MSKKQTRRSVSIRGLTYETLRQYCERHDMSMSEFVEDRIARFFGSSRQETVAAKPLAIRSATRRQTRNQPAHKLTSQQLQDAARIFTF